MDLLIRQLEYYVAPHLPTYFYLCECAWGWSGQFVCLFVILSVSTLFSIRSSQAYI